MSIFNALKVVGNALKVLTITEAVTTLAAPDDLVEPAEATDPAALVEAPLGTEQNEGDEENAVNENNESGTIIEEIELEAKYLVARIKELLHEGNIRKLVVKDSKGKYLLEIPLTVGVVAGGALAVTAPAWALLSAVAGFVANVKIEIVREVAEDVGEDDENAEDAD
ncbi:MAG: DUF4342 domain-containing protein [Anaerolineae bacterium]|nr:DUF4342 domain-containing protein [Anaerolineae bacterium]